MFPASIHRKGTYRDTQCRIIWNVTGNFFVEQFIFFFISLSITSFVFCALPLLFSLYTIFHVELTVVVEYHKTHKRVEINSDSRSWLVLFLFFFFSLKNSTFVLVLDMDPHSIRHPIFPFIHIQTAKLYRRAITLFLSRVYSPLPSYVHTSEESLQSIFHLHQEPHSSTIAAYLLVIVVAKSVLYFFSIDFLLLPPRSYVHI